jgi:hypothetical protein
MHASNLGRKAYSLWSRFLELFYKRSVVVILGLDVKNRLNEEASSLPITTQTRFENIPALRSAMLKAGEWDPIEIQRRQALGDICYTAMEGDRCVHYSWLTRRLRNITEIGHSVNLEGKTSWIYHSHTVSDQRGRSIYPTVLRHIAREAAERGDDYIWIDVEDKNTPSLKGARKAGFTEALRLEKHLFLSCLERPPRRITLNDSLGGRLAALASFWGSPNVKCL